MQSKKTTFRSFMVKSGKKRHGFTMAELIVVIVIIAIVATAGIVAAVGFMSKSKFDQNSQNAITVYQTAQTAISQKVANGSIETWVLSNFSASDFSDEYFLNTEEGKGLLNEPNKAVHRAVHLTTNPGNTSSPLYQLLNGYFYDNTVFAGTMSVEFDISAVKQNDGSVGYSATVLSAFYSKENKANDGWDSTCLGNSQDGLPQRDFTYRHDTSHVGYYYGSQESIDGTLPNGGGPVPVALPGLQNAAIDFFMRNGETLDLTWAMFDNTSHDANLKITLKNEDDSTAAPVVLEISEKELLYSWQDSSKPKSLDYANVIENLPSFPADTFASNSKVVYEEIKYAAVDGTLKTMNITKTSKEALAVVKCNGTSYQIPLVVTFVNGDTRDGYPATGYLTYTLCLDCLMTRSDYESGSDIDLFSVSRFFGNNIPTNISASISGTVSGSNIESTNATRAINDPIAFEAVRMSASNPTYCYVLGSEKRGTKDTDTKCVVNTLFGDGVYGSVPGTEYNSISKNASASVSAFRHLSNIRLVEDDVSADFTIVRNLNWYEKLTANNITYYVSDVKVFKRYGNASSSEIGFRGSEGYSGSDVSHSPASGNNLKVVSFPALPVIDSNKTLTALDNCLINSVQLRKLSFDNSDTGRGLICENRGKITNIQTNNLSLVLNSEIRNGTSSDYSTITIAPADITAATGAEKDIAVGGLIGMNSGEVGSSDGIIRMSNCIVMTGNYWTNTDKYTKGTGGVIGANTGSSALINGELEINGDFVVSGYTHVGGIVGFNNSSFDTKLTVNGTEAPSSEFSNLKIGAKKASCIISGWDYVGGAIGETDASSVGDISVKYSGTDDKSGIVRGGAYIGGAIGYNKTSVIDSVSVEGCVDILGSGNWVGGSVGFNEARITNVKVKYTGSSFVKGQDNVSGAIGLNNADITDGISVEYTKDLSVIGTGDYVGGAIGQITSGNIKSVSVISASENAGALKITGTKYVGGAIGYNKESVIETVSVNCSTIITGSGDNIGGAIGCNEDKASITGSVSVEGNSNITTTGKYAGGAIGINKSNNVASVTVKADIYINTEDDYVGGAIGYNEASIAGNVSVEGSTNISTTGNNVGGAIGKNVASVNRVVVKINNNSTITGNDYVGGAIGWNYASVLNGINVSYDKALKLSGSQFIGGAIGLTDADTVGDVNVTGSGEGIIEIDGSTYLGGAIGHNKSSLNRVTVDGKLGIRGDSDYVGGVIGKNENSILVALTASVSGSVVSDSGNYVGGAIGYNNAVVKSVSATILSGSTIEGNDYTAGAIGYNGAGIIDGVTSVIESSSNVYGNKYVGGAIGSSAVQLSLIDSTVSGVVKGDSNYIGGAISETSASITTVRVKISGSVIGNSDNSDYVGGAIGCHKSSISEQLTVEYSDSGEVSGHNNIGGVIGRLDGTVSSNSVSVELTDGRTVKGNSYVGGVIGYNYASLDTVSAIVNGTIIGGGENIGGAIGINEKPITNISTVLSGSVTGTGDKVGGVIGYNNNAKINMVSITTTGNTSLVQGSSYVGGLIGYLNYSNINEPLSASFSSGTSIKGSSDGSCVGGLCGCVSNDKNSTISINKAVNLSVDGVTIEGGTKVGGAFGYLYNTKINSTITVTASNSSIKSLSGSSDSDLGGAIGFTEQTVTYNGNITVSLTKSDVSGNGNCVGGAIGHNRSTLKDVTVNINTGSFVKGYTSVGGAFGWSEGYSQNNTKIGNINNITVNINSEEAIKGTGTMGGVFGRIGKVPDDTNNIESWADFTSITLVVKVGKLFK